MRRSRAALSLGTLKGVSLMLREELGVSKKWAEEAAALLATTYGGAPEELDPEGLEALSARLHGLAKRLRR